MHELPITESIVKIAVEAAGGRRITVINLLIGDLASIVDDSVQFYFDILSKGTLADGACLHFDRRPAVAACKACGNIFQPSIPLTPACPQCGSPLITVTGGREMRVDSIEVADEAGNEGQSGG